MEWSLVKQAEGWAEDARLDAERVSHEEDAIVQGRELLFSGDWGDLDPEVPTRDIVRAADRMADAACTLASMADQAGSEEGLAHYVAASQRLAEAVRPLLHALISLAQATEAEASLATNGGTRPP